MRIQFLSAVIAIALITAGSAGCDKPDNQTTGNGNSAAHEHDHGDEGHDDHSDEKEVHAAHGPNGGHVFKFDSPDFIGEWQKFKDNSVIKMHILDKDENPVLAKVDSFKVVPLTGNDPTPFELEAESPDADGKTSVYSLDDQNLSIAIPLGVSIEIVMGDTTLKGKIDQHEPLDH